MRENDNPVVTGQRHFPHPRTRPTYKPERPGLVRRRPVQALAQYPYGETPSRVDAGRQGTSVTQPVQKGDVFGSAQQIVTPAETVRVTHAQEPDRVIVNYRGAGDFSRPLTRLPALMPLLANQPWFISRA